MGGARGVVEGDPVKSINDHPTVAAARELAVRWHAGQARKYSGDPYTVHCERVAALTAMVCPEPSVVAAAWLHDVLEDTDCPEREIKERCGTQALRLILEVTDISGPSDGNRSARKARDRQHLSFASAEGQTIKLADLIDNTMSIAFWDPDFSRTYLEELRELLNVLALGDVRLGILARDLLVMAEQHVMDCATAGRIGRWA